MTTPSTTRKAGPYTGNSSQTEWPFEFKVFEETDVAVTVSVDGTETVLGETDAYSVTLNADQDASPGGTVTYPTEGDPVDSTVVLSITGNVEFAQTLDLPSGGDFSPTAIENALDRVVMLTQQLKEEVDRAVKTGVTEDLDPNEYLDAIAADVAGATAQAGLAASYASAAEAARDTALGAASASAQAAASEVADTVAAQLVLAQGAAASAQIARDITLDALDHFDDRYLGAKAVNPTVDNDGDPLLAGALFFDSTAGVMKIFTGTTWVAAYVAGADYLLICNALAEIAAAGTQATARANLGLADLGGLT